MSDNTFAVGDKVIIDPMYAGKRYAGKVFTITKMMKVNYRLEPVDGVGSPVKAEPFMLQPAPKELLDKPVVVFATLDPGALVRVKGARNIHPDTLFVVLANGPKVKIAQLGGDDGKYWNMPRALVEKVSIDLPAATASATVLESATAAAR